MKNKFLTITCLASLLAVVFLYKLMGQDITDCPVNESINFESKDAVISRFIQTANKITNIDSANENAAEIYALYALLQDIFLNESMQHVTISKQEQELIVTYTNEIARLQEHNYYNSQILKYALNIYKIQCQHLILEQNDINSTLIKKIEEVFNQPFSMTQIYRMYVLRKTIELYQHVGYCVSDETRALFEELLFKIRNHTICNPSLRDNRIIKLMVQEENPANIKKRVRNNRNNKKNN